MVQPADRDSELVAGLPPHRPLLRKFDVVGVRGGPAADETPLSGHKSQMVAVALPQGFADDRDLLRCELRALFSEGMTIRFMHLRGCLIKLGESGFKDGLDRLGVRR